MFEVFILKGYFCFHSNIKQWIEGRLELLSNDESKAKCNQIING